MNILQQEDMIKGLPDDRLIQEAKQPSGQLPQYLLVSEVQRRADMRKRFESQQKQPEGTVADQILQQGIGAIQRPAPGTEPPPPQMPMNLPTGEGIVPSGMQYPPPQPPNAELFPEGGGQYATGGLVRMSTGRQLPGQVNSDIPMWNESMLNMRSPDVQPRYVNYMVGEEENARRRREEEARTAIDATTGAQAVVNRYPNLPSMTAGHGDTLSMGEEADIRSGNQKDWYDPLVKGATDALKWRPFGGKPAEFMQDMEAAAADNIFTLNPKHTVQDTAEGLWGGIKSLGNDVASAWNTWNYGGAPKDETTKPTVPELPKQTETTLPRTTAPAQEETLEEIIVNAQKKPAGGLETKGFGMEVQSVSQSRNNEYDQLLKQQRHAAWSNALVQLGAGIAGNDLAGGLSKAGMAMDKGQDNINTFEVQRIGHEAEARRDADYIAQRDRELKETIAQRDREANLRAESGGDNSQIQYAQWLLSLPESSRSIINGAKGRTSAKEEIDMVLFKALTERTIDPEEAEQFRIDAYRRAGIPIGADAGGLPQVTTKEDYDALPPNTAYIDPNGNRRVKQ